VAGNQTRHASQTSKDSEYVGTATIQSLCLDIVCAMKSAAASGVISTNISISADAVSGAIID
jgi:hypothetical protein